MPAFRSLLCVVLATWTILATWASAGHAQPAATELKVLSPGALMSSLKQLVPQFEASSGYKVAVTYSPALAVAERVKKGEDTDIAIMGQRSAVELEKLGRVVAGDTVIVARVGVGVFVRRGDPKPDVSTVDAFKHALMSANVIAYSDPALGGSASNYVSGLLDSLDTDGSIRAKTRLAKQYRSLANVVAAGGVDFGLNQITEIMADQRLELVGPLPAPMQRYTNYAAVVPAISRNRSAAKRFLEFLATPDAVAVMRRNGFEQR